jgi:nicotinate-nucleotide adenylyltransferase
MRIGVFGGTFDPVHNGHVLPVEAAAMKFQLGRVSYVPARLSPHKERPPTDARHRVAMLALALSGRPDSARHPGDELWLLMGTDILAGFGRWREPEAILGLARIAAFHREPYVGPMLSVPEVPGLADRLAIFDAGSVKISATDLRNDLAAGKSVGSRVPGPVAEYITKHGLYKPGMPQR